MEENMDFGNPEDRMAGEPKARELLISMLTDEQRESMKTNGNFTVIGGDTGWKYIVKRSRAWNVILVHDHPDSTVAGRIADLCAAPSDLPMSDTVLQVKLMLESKGGETKFLEVANNTASISMPVVCHKECYDAWKAFMAKTGDVTDIDRYVESFQRLMRNSTLTTSVSYQAQSEIGFLGDTSTWSERRHVRIPNIIQVPADLRNLASWMGVDSISASAEDGLITLRFDYDGEAVYVPDERNMGYYTRVR